MKTYTSSGHKFLACGPTCAESFKEDRRQGLIYGSIPPSLTREASSISERFCAYCGEDV